MWGSLGDILEICYYIPFQSCRFFSCAYHTLVLTSEINQTKENKIIKQKTSLIKNICYLIIVYCNMIRVGAMIQETLC